MGNVGYGGLSLLRHCYLPFTGIRKYIKTKSVFPHDQAAMKAVYLAIANIEKKWTMSIRDWGMILQQFLIKFEDRCRI
jgi:transposase-like protein